MRKITPLSELPLRNDFMFSAVMQNESICQLFLQELLGVSIQRIEYVDKQKDLSDSHEYHGIRLDVYLRDEAGTVYNVEMQTAKNDDLPRRARFYQSAIDRKALDKNASYRTLPDSYVIFICDFDCFQTGYAVEEPVSFLRDSGVIYEDGSHVFFLNSHYRIKNASAAVLEFLDLVRTNNLDQAYQTSLGQKTRDEVKAVRSDQKWEVPYMTFAQKMDERYQEGHQDGHQEGLQEGLREGRQEGRQEGLQEGLQKGRMNAIAELKGLLEPEVIAERYRLPLQQVLQILGQE